MSLTSPMRPLIRYFILTLVLLISFFTFLNRSDTVLAQRELYPINKIPPSQSLRPRSKIVVVASQKGEDTDWLSERLPEWPVARYVVDDELAEFQVPMNKGREAMVYLTFLIDHYDSFPEIIVFIHSLQYQWHNDDPNHDGATVLSLLQLPYVEAEGYVNLRCVWVLGCPEELYPNDEMTEKSLATERVFRESYIDLFYGDQEMLSDVAVPDVIGVSCCAQFAISRDRALSRPKSDYVRFRQWLIDTPFDDDISGRVFEYAWHMIFGKPPVFCPAAQACYCNVFGLCDLKNCTEDACEGRYDFPSFTDIPWGWTQLPEYDEN